MRFSTAQLRMLQDTMATPVPALEAPPDILSSCPPQAQHSGTKVLRAGCEGEASERAAIPLFLAMGGYLLGAGMLALAASSPSPIGTGWLTLASSFFQPALLAHSAANQQDHRLAATTGFLCALLLPFSLDLASRGRSEGAAVTASLASIFFGLSSFYRVPELFGSCIRCASTFSLLFSVLAVAGSDERDARTFWIAAGLLLGFQSAACTFPLTPLSLYCHTR